MKRILLSFLAILLLVSCSAPAAPPAPQPGPTAAAAASQPPTAQPAAVVTASPAPQENASTPIVPGNVMNLKETASIAVENPYRLYFSPGGQHAMVAAQGQVTRFSLPALTQENYLAVTDPASLVAVNPVDNTIAVTSDHRTIQIVSMESGQVLRSLQPAGDFSGGFFTPDGAALAVVKVNEIGVDLYDVSGGDLIRQFSGFETAAPVYNVFPSSDGKTLVWVSRGRIQLMDAASGRLGFDFSHEDFISGWALSPDGSLLATSAGGTKDGAFQPLVYLWDARSGSQLEVFTLPQAPAASLAFSPDGQLLAAAAGKTIQLWRVADHAPLIALPGPPENISYLAFSPDGGSLLASAQDGAVHLWQVIP